MRAIFLSFSYYYGITAVFSILINSVPLLPHLMIDVDLATCRNSWLVNEVHLMPVDGMFVGGLSLQNSQITHNPKYLATNLAKAYALQYLYSKNMISC